jgi:hypothetical protein
MRRVRRLVTGHDEGGKSVFSVGGRAAAVSWARRGWRGVLRDLEHDGHARAHHGQGVWEPNERPLRIPPDPGGTIIRMLDIHPGHAQLIKRRADGRHPGMHRTETIDYGIMIEGELWLLLDDTEQLIRAEDVVVQRGTDHAWENRSDATARIAFVLIDGRFTGALAERLKGAELMHTTLETRDR